MDTDRIKEIQQETAYPESVSVQQALLKVWNETVQEQLHIGDVNQQREQLLAFCDHLNTYAGMEEIRFDFMMQDFIDKSQ